VAIIEVSVAPLGTSTTSVSKYVAAALKLVKAEKGIKYELTGMGTILEGELGQLLALVRKMHESVFEAGAVRVYTVVKIDDRRDKETGIAYKVESVKKKLG
jgi:uncharacterized protein (TIGR00106 family)